MKSQSSEVKDDNVDRMEVESDNANSGGGR